MGAVLTMGDELQAYTLSDRATYLARTLQGLNLQILVEGDQVLFNPYGVIAVNPDKGPQIDGDLANQFIDWLISMPTQEMIGQFGVEEFGQPLFTPDSAPWRAAQSSQASSAAPATAALKTTGKVATQMAWSAEEVRAMPTIDAQYTNKDGQTNTYTGVPLNELLKIAGVQTDATKLIFVASDGFTGEVTLAEAQSCQDCIVAFDEGGGFNMVMPGFSGKAQVKGVVEIQVQ
jgi:hypothetical protein